MNIMITFDSCDVDNILLYLSKKDNQSIWLVSMTVVRGIKGLIGSYYIPYKCVFVSTFFRSKREILLVLPAVFWHGSLLIIIRWVWGMLRN